MKRRYSIQVYVEGKDKRAGGHWVGIRTSTKSLISLLVRAGRDTAKGGVAHRIISGRKVVTFKHGDDGITVVNMPFKLLMNILKDQAHSQDDEIDELSGNVKLLKGALAPHVQLRKDIATSKDIARRNLRSLGKKGGFTYKCRDCSLYFTSKYSKDRGIRCRYCKSGDIVRVRLSGTKRK